VLGKCRPGRTRLQCKDLRGAAEIGLEWRGRVRWHAVMKRILAIGVVMLGSLGVLSAAERLEAGDEVTLTLRGVEAPEQAKVSGEYTVTPAGRLRVPFLEAGVAAEGRRPDELARAIEAAYRDAGIYTAPAIEVVARKMEQAAGATVSVSGQVKGGGVQAFRQGMTVLQAIDGAGGRGTFAGRNIHLHRDGRVYCLDFKRLEHKNIVLESGDSLQVEEKAAFIDRWKGSDEAVAPLLEGR